MNSTFSWRLLGIFLLIGAGAQSQKIPLINSGEVMERAKVLLDSGKTQESIKEFLRIPERDTNYMAMQKELAFAYLAAEDYANTIATANSVLRKPTEFRSDLLRARAAATSRQGNLDEALKLYEAAIAEFPIDMSVRYSRAIAWYNAKQYDKATQQFFDVLSVNPFYSGCHLHLALMAMRQGRRAHAMFAMGTYIALSTSDNPRLVLLNNFLDNQLPEDGTEPPIGSNSSDRLDQIIRAKVALQDNFKSAVPIGAAVVKQYELLFNQLILIPAGTDNPWVKFYLPFFKAVSEQQATEAFIYHLLTSANNEVAAKWRGKNKDKLETFYTLANVELKKIRDRITMPGFPAPVKAWYYNDNEVEAVGEKSATDVRYGPWIIYGTNGVKEAEGEYLPSGAKKGRWKFYFNTGVLKSDENYDNGEVTVFRADGTKSEHFFLNIAEDKIHGPVELYYSCEPVYEKIQYELGERHGKFEQFFPNGTLSRSYSYNHGKIEGEFKRFHANGKLYIHQFMKAGKSSGRYVTYYPSGKKEMEGQYLDDVIVGDWVYYHPNGRRSRQGHYNEKGNGTGEWIFYDLDGNVDERRPLDEEGRWHGDVKYFQNGKPHYTVTLKKAVIIKVTHYNLDGSVKETQGSSDGSFACTYYFPTGEKLAEGKYVKGQKGGNWKYYNRYGSMTSQSDYKDGNVHGKLTRYYYNGAVREVAEYADDELDGYVTRYHLNGKISAEGWYKAGQQQQQWLTYDTDGSVLYDHYYLNGEFSGDAFDKSSDGKIYYIGHHEEGVLKSIRRFDETGEITPTLHKEGWLTRHELPYANGKTRESYRMACGDYHGESTLWYPDGGILSRTNYLNGEREGSYEFHEIDQVVTTRGTYENGKRSGLWQGFHDNGQPYSVGRYLAGEYDSTWSYFFDNGKPSSVSFYRGDLRNGVATYYAPNGQPLLEKTFYNDDMVSYRPLNADGTPQGDWVKFTGTATIDIKYPDGSSAWHEELKHGSRNGRCIIYYPGGKPASEYTYLVGDYHGPYSTYYPNGQVKERGNFTDDQLEGTTEHFYENGKPMRTENFHVGARFGKSIQYDEQGKVKKEFIFWNGTPMR